MNDLTHAVRVLKSGGIIAYPTETSYGLGCDPRDTKAVGRIFKIKGRDSKKSVLLVASSIAQVWKIALLDGASLRLAKMYWPGPLTFVLPAKRGARLSRHVIKHGEVAVRVSSSKIVQQLTRRFGFPIVSTSANRSGEVPLRSGRSIRSVFAQSSNAPDFILDAGVLPLRKPSTIARVGKTGDIEVLRQGGIRL